MPAIYAPKEGICKPSNLKRIKINHLKWLKEMKFQFPSRGKIRIVLQFKILNRDNGESAPIWTYRTFSIAQFKSTKQIVDKVRALAKFFVTHEIDECIYFDNKRIFDPHK